jgi:hypothetical protein
MKVVALFCMLEGKKRILVVAIGGGGDIASASMIANSLERMGYTTVLASIAWERYIYDPVPGPIRLSEVENPSKRGDYYILVNEDSYATRGGRLVIPQAVKASRALGREVYIIDMYSGVEGYVKGLSSIISDERVDLVIGVDVGGDVLAGGSEEDLWSPLADWIGLAALFRLNGIVAVHSPGSDGELSTNYLIKRIDEVAAKGGLLGVSIMCMHDAVLLEKILKYVDSEASRIPLLAYQGRRGQIPLRKGSRVVEISLFNTMTFYMDSKIVIDLVEPAKKLLYTKTLDEARRILNELGIYTELDLEEDLARLNINPTEVTSDLLISVRSTGLKRLRSKKSI